jgi:hypothetical protein
MADRSFRSLENLEKSASTARVLNLLKVFREYSNDLEWQKKPLFVTTELNSCLIIKHRLRRDEYDRFNMAQQVATKLIIPIDRQDLRTGGRYIFIKERDYEKNMSELFGIIRGHPDFNTLELIDELPSLDPFILREKLARAGIEPATCYFDLSDADTQSMVEFVKSEITPLVKLCMENVSEGHQSVDRMAAKILSNRPGNHADALGATLRLSPDEYQEGIFCWKGFLYYKWSLAKLLINIEGVSDKISTIRPVGPSDKTTKEYIVRSQKVLRNHISRSSFEVRQTLNVYDNAYRGLTQDGNPMVFRDFLLKAPSLFMRLGEQIGALQHIVSFCQYRLGPRSALLGSEELVDMLMDFEVSLQGSDYTKDR